MYLLYIDLNITKNFFLVTLYLSLYRNYEISNWYNNSLGFSPKIVPGCLFGGKKDILVKNLQDFDKIQEKLLIDTNYIYSEQEILYACLRNKKCEFFEFDDWLDLQRGILKLIDQYNESEYKTNRWV